MRGNRRPGWAGKGKHVWWELPSVMSPGKAKLEGGFQQLARVLKSTADWWLNRRGSCCTNLTAGQQLVPMEAVACHQTDGTKVIFQDTSSKQPAQKSQPPCGRMLLKSSVSVTGIDHKSYPTFKVQPFENVFFDRLQKEKLVTKAVIYLNLSKYFHQDLWSLTFNRNTRL